MGGHCTAGMASCWWCALLCPASMSGSCFV
jgi:hypothetical protein